MEFELKPELIQPVFLETSNSILEPALFLLLAGIVSAFIIIRATRAYSILRILFNVSKTGIKPSAYQLTANKMYKRLYRSNIISSDDLRVINNIKYQNNDNVSSNEFSKIVKRIALKALTGRLNAS